MARSTRECNFTVIYGGAYSISVHVEGRTEDQCMGKASVIMDRIKKNSAKTVLWEFDTDVKGNYQSTVVSTRRKYKAVS